MKTLLSAIALAVAFPAVAHAQAAPPPAPAPAPEECCCKKMNRPMACCAKHGDGHGGHDEHGGDEAGKHPPGHN